ncbi:MULTISPECIES: alpha-L-rhamnosidase [Bifidobacterium]|uniref:alpha-L-rhamnosidase n=1 Tax=Bifidobacterium TaxID=1678 RepID=UPI001BDD24C4|nr:MULTISPECIES: alpha-L-rhamnosidase [Bifidobacterium]MBT1161098.1 family 78 glycoside hydrolase catalytic domain [Bifidobacterium sp. SO1]MBW3078172.1 family 78 glycoside hydrolase catalytic domain [Bifidobacterium simiiventris]
MTTMTEPVRWQAQMIGGPDDAVVVDPVKAGGEMRRPPVIRCDFDVAGTPAAARLCVTAWGLFEAELNGRRVGEDVLAPGWTVYDERLPYWTYDVTDLVHDGANVLGFRLGDGWYRGQIGFNGGQCDNYGDRLGVFAQLELTDADGTVTIVASNADDGRWKAGYGPILASGLYEGETLDAREERDPFAEELSDHHWRPVERLDFDQSVLYPADESTAVCCIGEHQPVSINRLPDGRWLVDFGQNCTQRVVLTVPATEPGREIDIQHVEVINPDGTPATRPLRRAIQHDHYISDGSPAVWEPRFTMHGFRYAVIGGWPADRPLTAADLHTRVYSSARHRLGWFSCSDERVNRLAENARWSMLSNFVSIPTDCPQRDERFGWTGDIAVFAPTAAYLYDVNGFLDSWLTDVAIETERWGTVPYYVPYPFPGWGKPDAVALWGDAATMVPWALYMATGDVAVLRRHIGLSRRWMDEVAGLLADDGVWDRKPDVWCGQLGDWLDPTAPPDDAARAMTDKALVATAFAAHSADLVARMLRVLGDTAAQEHYEKLAAHIRAGFRARFVRSDGTMTSDTQCAYALLIALDLLAGVGGTAEYDRLRAAAGERLVKLVRERGFVVGTGFAGTPFVLPALCATGHADEAFSLFLSDRCPSWLYQVRMGATTTWERWDSMLENGEVNPGDMTSFNHYAFGSVLDWMHSAIGGLELADAGWSRVRVRPQIVAALAHGVTSGSAAHVTLHGRVSVSWSEGDDGHVRLDVDVPQGVEAELGLDLRDETGRRLPAGTLVAPGVHRLVLA